MMNQFTDAIWWLHSATTKSMLSVDRRQTVYLTCKVMLSSSFIFQLHTCKIMQMFSFWTLDSCFVYLYELALSRFKPCMTNRSSRPLHSMLSQRTGYDCVNSKYNNCYIILNGRPLNIITILNRYLLLFRLKSIHVSTNLTRIIAWSVKWYRNNLIW